MKYFLDTEFIEGFHKPLFGKKRHFIDLISIGIVAEDKKEFYAISSEYNYKDADQWVKDNVILPLYLETVHGDNRNHFSVDNFHKFYGKKNKEIMYDIIEFICPNTVASDYAGVGSLSDGLTAFLSANPPEFYAYYADYDWVVFCSLFGRMIDPPDGFPMYCRDLKQMLDEKAEKKDWYYGRDIWSNTKNRGGMLQDGDKPASLKDKLGKIKSSDLYPKQEKEHNALEDAKWNKQLFEFINLL